MKAWRRPHKKKRVLQDGHVYILYTGQKVHFERMKRRNGGPMEWAALPASGDAIETTQLDENEIAHQCT